MKIKYFDRAIEWLFLALMLLTPIIFDRRIGIVFSGTKSAEIRLLLIVILTIWVIKLLLTGKHTFYRSILDWPIMCYLVSATAATITGVNVIISLFGFYGRYEGLVTWYCYALMFFIAVNYLRSFDKLKQFYALIMPTAVTMAIYGIIQRMGIDPYAWGGVVTWQRVIATIGQPNFLSAYMDMAFFIILFFLLSSNNTELKKTDWPKALLSIGSLVATPILFMIMIFSLNGQEVFIWYLFFIAIAVSGVLFSFSYKFIPDIILKGLAGISLLLIYTCNFYTQSRGGSLGFIVAFVILISFVPRKRLLRYWIPLGFLACGIIIVTGITSLNQEAATLSRFGAEIKVGQSEENSQLPQVKGPEIKKNSVELSGAAGSRGETWKSAYGIISDNPAFGIGPEDLKMVFPRYETDLFRFKEAFHVKQDRCHNESFDVPVTKGLITFLIYIWILFSTYQYGFKMLNKVDDDKKVYIVTALAAMASYLIQNQFSFGVIAITSLFWVLWALVINVDTPAVVLDKDSEKVIKIEDIPWLWIALITIIVLLLTHISLLQFQADKHFKMGKTFMDMRRFEEAIASFDKSLKAFPFEGGAITHYGITLLNFGMTAQPQDQGRLQTQALQMFDYGIKVDPYNADNFYISSRIFLMQGNIPKTYEYSIKALKIDPYYAEAYLTLAMLAERQGNMTEAQKCYNEAARINPTIADAKIKIAFSLINAGKLDEAFKMLQEMLGSNPRNPDLHNGLGIIYSKQGNSVRAKEEFEQALHLDPNNAFAKSMLKK